MQSVARLTRLLTVAERDAMNDAAMAVGYFRDDPRIFHPGMAWYEPWYWDPQKALELGTPTKEAYLERFPKHDGPFHGIGLLSVHYWNTWSRVRPPITVVLPNHMQWEIDRKSSNGTGWTVSGTFPDLVCTPSIAAKGYHGYLGSNGVPPGHFCAHLDNPATPRGTYPYPLTWRRPKLDVDGNVASSNYGHDHSRNPEYDIVPGNPPKNYRELYPRG